MYELLSGELSDWSLGAVRGVEGRSSLCVFNLNLAVVERLNDSERLYTHTMFAQILSAILECLLDDEAHAFECGSRLLAEVDDTLGCVAVCKEVVDEITWSSGVR